jgi:hypothetical protein
MNMNRRRSSPKAVIAATVISLLMLALIPSSTLAAEAVLTFTQTDCAGGAAGLGSLQMHGYASGLPAGADVWVEFGVIPDGSGGWLVYDAQDATVLGDGTVSATSKLIEGLTLAGGEQVDLMVTDQNSGEVYATAMALVACAPPAMPTTKADCLHGGWADWGIFRNTGECLKFVRNL